MTKSTVAATGGKVLSAAVSALMLSACGTTLKTIELQPDRMVWTDDYDTETSGFLCGLPVVGTLSRYSPGPNEIIVGYDDWYDPGTDPFPCTAKVDHYYRGGVRFDLSQFDSVTGAQLVFDVDQSRIGPDGVGQNPAASYATTLGIGNYPFAPAQGMMSFDNPRSLSASNMNGATISAEVGGPVRDWISGSHFNLGFVLSGPREDFPEDNESFVSWYVRFKLVIQYNPAQNPRAPQ